LCFARSEFIIDLIFDQTHFMIKQLENFIKKIYPMIIVTLFTTIYE
jgi:hypothetical protein